MEKVKQARRLMDIASQVVHDSRQDCLSLATAFDEAESQLNEGLGCIRTLIVKTAAATSAMSVETNDRDDNELKYLQDALSLIHTTTTVKPMKTSSSWQGRMHSKIAESKEDEEERDGDDQWGCVFLKL